MRVRALLVLGVAVGSGAWHVPVGLRQPVGRRVGTPRRDATRLVAPTETREQSDTQVDDGAHDEHGHDKSGGGVLSIVSKLQPPNASRLLSLAQSGELTEATAAATSSSWVPGALMVRRTAQIWTFISAMVIKSYAWGTSNEDYARRFARECRDGLLALGPTFIKLGQLLSTRVDVMPQVFVDELSTLQDNCPPFPVKDVLRIIEEELGENPFAEFDEEPLAAASLGQVHLATTKEGERVAVKVQRPGLRELFSVDLKNLQVVAEMAMNLDRTPDRVLRDWREIFEQNARIIYEEIDYTREADNADKFAENFKNIPWLRVPKVYREYSGKRVITMEYVPGVKVNKVDEIDKLGLDRKKIATYAAESYLLQLLRFGFFHCDPHPGNVAVEAVPTETRGVSEPRIILYDYGMMGTLSPELKKGFVKGFFGVYENDYLALADSLYEAGLIGEDTDRLSVEIIARYFINTFNERFAMDRKKAPADREERSRMRIQAMQSIGQELAAIGGSKPFRYPEAFPFVLRAFTALEGIGKSLDKDYDVYRIARRYLVNLADLKEGGFAASAVRSVQKKLGLRPEDLLGFVTFPRKINKLQRFTNRLETGEVKLRVRALEAERAIFRANLLLKACAYAAFASLLLNLATWTSLTMGRIFGMLHVVSAGAIYCVARAVICLFKLRSVLRDEENRYYNNYIGG